MTSEREALRREVLDALAPLLYEHLAANEWGRALVRTSHRNGRTVVTSIDVEDIVGDDALIDAAMESEEVRHVLPAIAHACEALAETFDMTLDSVEGGTLIRQLDGLFVWLPGLVRAPSEPFERLRDEALSRAAAALDSLGPVVGKATRHRFELDVAKGTIAFMDGERAVLRADVTVLGSFAKESAAWVWAWANPSTPPEAEARSRELCDACPHRAMWELTTPQFAADEGTCWALAAIVAMDVPSAIVLRVPDEQGAIFFLLRGMIPAIVEGGAAS